MTDQLDRYMKAATRFRQMIENTDRLKLPIGFENFPMGSSGGPYQTNRAQIGNSFPCSVDGYPIEIVIACFCLAPEKR